MLQKGFSLIEMLIVIAILGIVAAVTVGVMTKEPENVIQKEKVEWKQHLESVKDKIFIIEIDGKKHSVVVKDVQE